MSFAHDTTGSVGEQSPWADPAMAYASSLLDASVAATAVQEALDVVAYTDAAASGPDGVLAIVRHTVARRMPRPAPAPVRRGLGRLGRGPRSSACSQMPELLAARAASMLSPGDVDRIAVHLDRCAACTALEERMAGADEAFRAQADIAAAEPVAPAHEQPETSGPFSAPGPATWAGTGPTREEERFDWVPEEFMGPAAEDEITVTRGAMTGPAAGATSEWLLESEQTENGSAAMPAASSSSDWIPSGEVAIDPAYASAAAAPVAPSRGRRRRSLTAVALVATAAAAGGGLAAAGVFEGGDDPSGAASVATTAQPPAPKPSTTRSRERATKAAERRRAERRRAASQRRAAARKRAAARRRAASRPVVSAPVATPRPAPAAPTPARPTPPPTRTTPRPTQTTPAQTTPSDAPKPSAPSSEPGRQVLPTP